jgi:Flp pilus assembly protein TadG
VESSIRIKRLVLQKFFVATRVQGILTGSTIYLYMRSGAQRTTLWFWAMSQKNQSPVCCGSLRGVFSLQDKESRRVTFDRRPIPPYSAWRGKFDAPFEHPPANCTYFLIDRSGSAEFAERPGTRRRSFSKDEQGGLLPLFALALPILGMVAAMAVELAEVSIADRKLQNIVDATALGAARQLSVDPSAATLTRATVEAHGLAEPLRKRWSVQAKVTSDPAKGTLTVELAAQRSSFFGNLVPPGGFHLQASATASSAGKYPLCVLALKQGSATAATLADSSALTAGNCLIQSNGDLSASGGARVSAAFVRAAGKASGRINPNPITDAPQVKDPFASIPINVPLICNDKNIKVGNAMVTLNPGVHCGDLDLKGTGTLFLNAGEHYFVGDEFELGGNVTVTGTDVVVILKGQSKVEISGNATLSLDGRRSGSYAGFAIITDRSLMTDVEISAKTARKIHGTVYLPSASLKLSGNNKVSSQSPWTIVVANSVRLAGSADLVINTDYASSPVPVPIGVGPGITRLQK